MADIVAENSIEKIVKGNEEFEASSPELQKQQSENTNSHHHDSEYDTANYDTSDDENADDSLEQEDEEDNKSSTGTEFDEEDETQRGETQEQIDYMKKVDEDRSNPQYIPKKGTFYEHDDRTTEDPDVIETQVSETSEGIENNSKTVTPTISSASKTMKKWQAASGVDRWSHDRFEESEQVPKSRAELVSAYGYDIRNEDGPPRARRRRRYGRGPTKYSRNWEDESAYIKANNIQRKPLRPEDFPVLGDRKIVHRSPRNLREEKENHYENRRSDINRRIDNRSRGSDGGNRPNNNDKNNRSINKRNNDFKYKNRSNNYEIQKKGPNTIRQLDNARDIGNNYDNLKSQVDTLSFTNTKVSPTNNVDSNVIPSQSQIQKQHQHNNERYNNGYDNFHSNQSSNTRELGNNLPNLSNSQQSQIQPPHSDVQINVQQQNSKLSNRLQQRNDPSHVGSVQMHTLASPQQNILPNLADHPTNAQQQQQQPEQAKPKRYSSLRQRTPNDNTVIQQNNQIEQLKYIQHDPAAQQQVLLYHQQQQEQVVAAAAVQLQSVPIQNLSKPPPQQFSNPVQSQFPPGGTGYYPTAPPPNEYVTVPPPPNAPIMQLAAAAYLQQQQQQTASSVQSQPPPPQTTNPQQPPPINYVQNPPPNYPPPPGPSPSQYPNYNTVGGTTYFVPHVQPAPRSNALPQRRPTNAIPILAPPSDKSKQHSTVGEKDQFGSVENIDHILDNMFVQRAPYVPPQHNPVLVMPTAVSATNNNESQGTTQTTTTENRLNEAIMNLQITDKELNIQSSDNQEESTTSSATEKISQTPENVIKSNLEISISAVNQQLEKDN